MDALQSPDGENLQYTVRNNPSFICDISLFVKNDGGCQTSSEKLCR